MAGRVLFGLVLLFFLPGAFSAFLYFAKAVLQGPGWLLPYLVGTIFGIFFDLAVVRKISALDILRHEVGHALTALVFFRRIDHFVVTRHGGEVYHSGGLGGGLVDDIIGLAPYTIPVLYLASVLVRPILESRWFPWFDVWVGFSFGLHLWGSFRDIRSNWSRKPFIGAWSGNTLLTDIASRGFVFSFIYIIIVSLTIHGILLAIMLKGYAGILVWSQQFWAVTQSIIEKVPRIINLTS